MKVIFANVTQGFVYADNLTESEGMVFRKFSIPDYLQYFLEHKPDILCLSEILIDDLEGNSEFAKQIISVTGLEHAKVLRTAESWIYDGKHYGMGIFSRYPISDYEEFKLPNPKFEVTRPNGDHWKMHDKYAQYAELEVNGEKIYLFNLHYFPVYHFNKSIDSKEMKPYRQALSKVFTDKGFDKATIITGDFNDKGVSLADVFPEIFDSGDLEEAIEVQTTILDGQDQLDHILYTPSMLELKDSQVEKFLSDHYALIAEFE
jgi:endonuclease/exonuclease/phosphatase family metal-dependent hydrolase